MQKSGGSVRMIVSPQPDHLTLITQTVDVVALSSEIMIDELFADILRTCRRTKTLVCDITDGADPLSADRPPLPEHLLQAATGLAQITGLPNTPPTISKVPFIAVSSALYAASFVLASRRVDPSDRYDQTVKVSRTLTALNALTTFLPAALQGQTLAPIGNSHPSSSPWYTYPTKDGSVLICTSKDKGAGKGALLYYEKDLRDAQTGTLFATCRGTTFLRGNGGFGGPSGPVRPPHQAPDTAPDFVFDTPTRPEQALLYRLNGDPNRLHFDPSVAEMAGFDRPILHGLASFGCVAHALLAVLCDYDAGRFGQMDARFTAHVFPGETL